MAKYTNTGLVKRAKMALALKTKYMWGGILRLIEKQYDLLKDHYSTKSDPRLYVICITKMQLL